jgi:hypothetical protein
VSPALEECKYLADKMKSLDILSSIQPSTSSARDQIDNYVCEHQQTHVDEAAVTFGSKRHALYSLLAEFIEDSIATPVLQVFVEHIF